MNYYSKQSQSNPTCSELACGEQGRTVESISNPLLISLVLLCPYALKSLFKKDLYKKPPDYEKKLQKNVNFT